MELNEIRYKNRCQALFPQRSHAACRPKNTIKQGVSSIWPKCICYNRHTETNQGDGMKSTIRRKTEWEVCQLDQHGDIQEVEYYDSKREAAKDFDAASAPKELWKTVWSYTQFEDGVTDDPSKDTQTMVMAG